jgi:hypothetical protein
VAFFEWSADSSRKVGRFGSGETVGAVRVAELGGMFATVFSLGS